ncbi:MAG: amidohydrolase [Desulfobacterales bacterium]|jgi:amidohydrolase|nr:amidohydrolase [Desulfobacteraceae bacterium]MBT7085323.1 amidohydrolase [Desulfobacterales bacterium]
MKSLMKEAEKLQDTLVKHRRYLHENAEVHMDLPITVEYVTAQLKAMGYEPEEICQSGVLAMAGKKNEGKTFLLRADMDALPMKEESDVPFRSKTGNMHACGHDLHTAMLLGAAELLKKHEDEIKGQVKLMFQPAEETLSGAKQMVEAGILENPKVDSAMMIHVLSGFPIKTGMVLVGGEGVISAAADWFKITVQGKGCHGGMPQMGVDPLNSLTHIYLGLQNINAREVAPGEVAVVTIGEIHGGNTGNIIPDTAYMQGTIRTYSDEHRVFVKDRVESIAKNIAESFRTIANVDFFRGCPCNINDKNLLDQMKDITKEFVGEDHFIDAGVLFGNAKFPGSEDFAYVAEKVPGVTISISSGSSEDGFEHPLHHPKALFDDSILYVGAGIYANTAIEWLKNNS